MDFPFGGIQCEFNIIDEFERRGLVFHMQVVRLRHHNGRAFGRGDYFLQMDERNRWFAAEFERGD